MKKLSRIKLHEAAILNDNEMKMVFGGYVGSSGSWSDNDGDSGSGADPCNSPTKVEACYGKSEKADCSFRYQCTTYYGRCLAFAPNYTLHCSDLN